MIFEVEKFHEKVKVLTHGFRRFLEEFQTFEIRAKDESLRRIR